MSQDSKIHPVGTRLGGQILVVIIETLLDIYTS